MGKYKENPKYNVVSIRVSDEERKIIRRLAESCNTSTTHLLREVLFNTGLLLKN
jgi:predicted transcriptional regulator